MNAADAQLAFAAEFTLFVVALGALAVVLLRADLVGVDRRLHRRLAAGGLLVAAGCAFARGSQFLDDPDPAPVLLLRVAAVAVVAAGFVRRPVGSAVLGAVAVADVAGLVLDDPGRWADGLRIGAAAAGGVVVVAAARRSIPARVASGAAATVLLVVLAVSVALSAVVVDNVEDEALRRTDDDARVSVEAAEAATADALVTATSVAKLLGDSRPAQQLLAALVDEPTSPDAGARRSALAGTLTTLADDVLTLDGLLALVTSDERSVAGPGVASAAAESQLPFLGPVADAIEARGPASGVELLSGELLAAAAAPISFDTPQGPRFVGVVVVGAALDDAWLAARHADRADVVLAFVSRDGIAARSAPLPEERRLARAARAVLDGGGPLTSTSGERYVAIHPLESAGRPIAALVASAQATLAVETRQSLFRTLFVVALVAALGAVVAGVLLGRQIGRGLGRLTAAARRIGAGDFDTRSDVGSDDELGVLGEAFDRMASSLREATAQLRDAAEGEARLRGRLEAVVGGMAEALVAVDGAGRVTDYNAAAAALFGRTASWARGKPVGRLALVTEDGTDLTARLARPPASRWTAEATVTRRDGSMVPVAVSGAALPGAGGEVAGAVAILRDLRGEREVERMKSEFLANISHEMRTPLTPIKGYATILSSRKLPSDRVQGFAGEIGSAAGQLERVIDQLVNFAAMAAGRLEVDARPVPARQLLDGAVQRWQARVGGSHTIRRRVRRGTPPLEVDRRLVDLALDELVDNAVKYSPHGGRVSLTAEAGEGGTVLLSVSDEGVGVDPAAFEGMLADFSQGDGSSTRSHGGLGLGLPTVVRVARAHGGDLRLAASSRKGTTFTLVLPAAR